MSSKGQNSEAGVETVLVTGRDFALGDTIAVHLAERGLALADLGQHPTPPVDALVAVSAERDWQDERLALHEIDQETWNSVLTGRVGPVLAALDICIPAMARRGHGKIIIVAESHGSEAPAVHVAAARSTLLGLSRSLALELAPAGVQVNAVLPSTGPSGGEPESADAVAFLLAEGGYFCGQVIETMAART